MVTKKKTTETESNKSKVSRQRLRLNRETIQDLTGEEQKQVKGGLWPTGGCPSVGCSDGCHGPKTATGSEIRCTWGITGC